MTLGGFCTETTGLQSSVTSFSVAFFFFLFALGLMDCFNRQLISQSKIFLSDW